MPGPEPAPPIAADPEPDDDRLTARERRAKRLREQTRANAPKRIAKLVGIGLAVVLVLSGAVWGIMKLNSLAPYCELEEKHLHEHATFVVYVPDDGGNAERIRFQHPAWDMENPPSGQGRLPPKMHMHQPDDAQLHAEFGCMTLGQLFDRMGGGLSADRLQLDSYANDQEAYAESGNQTLRFFLFGPDLADPSGCTGSWSEQENLAGHQPRDLERILITFGNWTEAQIQEQKDSVPMPTDSIPRDLRGAC